MINYSKMIDYSIMIDYGIYDFVLKKYGLYNLAIPNFRIFLHNFVKIFGKFDKREDIQSRYNVVYKDTEKVKKARKLYLYMYKSKYGKTSKIIG